MHERDRSERRFTDRGARNRKGEAPLERPPPHRGRLHQEFVRVLPVDQGQAVGRFARLEDFTISVFPQRGGFETEHHIELKRPTSDGTLCHPHPPVLNVEVAAAAGASLVVERKE